LVEEASTDKPQTEKKKKKAKYDEPENDDSGSDAQSDSEPSEDNLEDDAIMKLIPKKLGKKKFIKGLEEKKKKPVPPPEKKEVKKKPKTELMPCMSQKKEKEVPRSQRDASVSTAKKLAPAERKNPPLITTKMRNGGK